MSEFSHCSGVNQKYIGLKHQRSSQKREALSSTRLFDLKNFLENPELESIFSLKITCHNLTNADLKSHKSPRRRKV